MFANMGRLSFCVLLWLYSLSLLGLPQRASGADLKYYDPSTTAARPTISSVSAATIEIQPQSRLVRISDRFYGLNIHPGSWKYEFARQDLLKRLKPDSVRIMTLRRTDWLPGRRVTSDLSTAAGQYTWTELDMLVRGIVDIGAEPFLALGFGPPSWVSGASSPLERKPPLESQIESYADFMATITHRYAVEKALPVRRVTIDNEPENVGYSIEAYIQLVRLARQKIKERAPAVQVGGPTTGYAMWHQPDKRALDFFQSTRIFAREKTPFDFFDWHIYATSPDTVMRTVQAVRKVYGASVPLVISELNRDWRFSGKELATSVRNNTSWESVAWLAYLYDHLQVAGLDQVFYFAWREAALGLTDHRLTTLRPNFYLFASMTNLLGRQRVVSKSSHPTIGSIATNDNGRIVALVYNLSDTDVRIEVLGADLKTRFVFSRELFDSNSSPDVDLLARAAPGGGLSVAPAELMVPAGGFLVMQN